MKRVAKISESPCFCRILSGITPQPLFPKKEKKESFKGRYLWRFSFANTFPQFLFHFREQAVESKLKKVIPKVRVFSLPSLSSFSVAMITPPTLCPSPPALYFFNSQFSILNSFSFFFLKEKKSSSSVYVRSSVHRTDERNELFLSTIILRGRHLFTE